MKKNIFSFIFFLLFVAYANGNERSEKEIKLGVFLSDLEQIGDFKIIIPKTIPWNIAIFRSAININYKFSFKIYELGIEFNVIYVVTNYKQNLIKIGQ